MFSRCEQVITAATAFSQETRFASSLTAYRRTEKLNFNK